MGLISDFITNVTALRIKIGEKLLTLASRIGLLSSLTTVAKTDLVAAINEVNANTPNSYHKWFRVISPGYATTGILRIDIGTIFTGYVKIHLTGSFTNNNSNGYIEISGGLGANANSIWNNQLRCTTSIGQTRVNFYADPVIKRDAMSGQLYLEIHKKVAANNVFIVEIEAFAVSSFGSSGNTLNPVLNAFDSAKVPSSLTNEIEVDGQINSAIHGNSNQWLQGYNERVSQFNITYATNVYTFSVLLANGVQKQATLQVSLTHFEITPSTGVMQLNVATATKISNAFGYVRGLTSTEHLDTVLDVGVFQQTTSANATAANGYPVNLAGVLEVYKTGSSHLRQIYTPFSATAGSAVGNRSYQRYLFNGVWIGRS